MHLIEAFKTKEARTPSIIGWTLATVLTLLVIFLNGNVYGPTEGKDLLSAIQRASLYYGSAVAGTSATVLALMLTLLSLVTNTNKEIEKGIFTRLHIIALLCVVAFTEAIVLLLVISFPVDGLDKVPGEMFTYIYYAICIWNGMMAAHMISTIFILRDTLVNIIGQMSPDYDEEGNET
jgi:hypothetical protein